MQILIDEREQALDALGQCQSLGDIFKAVETDLIERERRLISDMEVLDATGAVLDRPPEEMARTLIEELGKASFKSIAIRDYARAEIDQTRRFLPAAVEGFERVSELLLAKDFGQGLALLGELTEGMQMFLQALDNIKSAFGVDLQMVRDGEGKSVNASIRELNQILEDMVDGLEHHDFILVNDYLAYELLPHLKSWDGKLDNILEAIS